MRDAVTAYIGIGANLGDAAEAVRRAVRALSGLPHTTLVSSSSVYRTAPIGAGGPVYANAVAQVATHLAAPQLLRELQSIENDAGRERPYPNAPRTLDLDLLLYGSGRIASPTLTVPHPRMVERAFVLVPLAEIAPALVPPSQLDAVRGQAIRRLPAT